MSLTKQKAATQNPQETPTASQSLVMMRNLLRTAISSIAYIRGVFPENCFSDRVLTGINIKTLQPCTEDSRTLCKWLEEGVFDALSKKYLRVLIFGIYTNPDEPSTLLECYNFNISYPGEDGVAFEIQKQSTKQNFSLQTKDQIKKSTVQLIRTLIAMATTLKTLPEDRYITMKLLYYDERTPADYEPQFFKEISNGTLGFDKKPVKIKIGRVQTPYHTMDLKIHTMPESFNEDSPQQSPIDDRIKRMKWSVEADSDDENEQEESQVSQSQPEAAMELEKDTNTNTNSHAASNKSQVKSSQDEETDDDSDDYRKVKQFVSSRRIVDNSAIRKEFPKLSPSTITGFLNKMKEEGSLPMNTQDDLWQRALEFVAKVEYVTVPALVKGLNVSQQEAKDLMNRFEENQIVGKPSKNKKGRRVLKSAVESALDKGGSDICARLAATHMNEDKEVSAGTTPTSTSTSTSTVMNRKRTEVPLVSQISSPKLGKRLQQKLAKFEFSNSQEPEHEVKMSVVKEPIAQKKQRIV